MAGRNVVRRGRLLAGSAALLASFGIVRAPAGAAQFELKCGASNAPDHPATVHQLQMWSAIQRESSGRVRVQFYPNSVLGSDASMFTQLRTGALSCQLLSTSNLSAVVPVADITNLGFAYHDAQQGIAGLSGPLGDYIRDEAAAKGLHVMRTPWSNGMNEISSGSHPIRVPDDLHGFKIRVTTSRIQVDLFRALGANPTALNFDEVYTALQTKVVDGGTAPLGTIKANRFYEVQKYISLTNHSWVGQVMIANGDLWKSLPADIQEIVERNNAKYALLEQHDTNAADLSAAAELARNGIGVNPVDQAPFRARLGSYYGTWASAFGPTAWGLLERSIGKRLA